MKRIIAAAIVIVFILAGLIGITVYKNKPLPKSADNLQRVRDVYQAAPKVENTSNKPVATTNDFKKIFAELADRLYVEAETRGYTEAIDKALKKAEEQVKDLLKNSYVNPQAHPEVLFIAASYGTVAMLNLLEKAGFDIHITLGGRTLLMVAALSGNVEIVKELLNRGVDVNAKDDAGKTAKDYAAVILDSMKNKEQGMDMFTSIPVFLIASVRHQGENPFEAIIKLIDSKQGR